MWVFNFFKRKKYFLFTYGNYFWGYENTLIKAIDEKDAIRKFFKPKVQEKPLKKQYNYNGKMCSTIKDLIENNSYTVVEIKITKE